MTPIAKSPLDEWIAGAIGLPAAEPPGPDRLARYQLARLNRTLAHAARHSPFYRQHWTNDSAPTLTRLEEIGSLPFTTAEDLRRAPMRLLCVSQDEIARVVTLNTSGTTGDPKRIFFSQTDLERTIDFFHHGMATLVRPGQRVLILLPGALPGSVGDLLRNALARMGVAGVVHGPIRDIKTAIGQIIDGAIDSLVGIPAQVLALARHPDSARIPPGRIRSILLSTDYVPRAVTAALRQTWDCDVFQHYGMTEMGYGGGVGCAAHDGYHLREADLLFEIVDPVTGQPVRDGRQGEVVFTTLNRRAMPLIRYRTGDLAAWIEAPCPCGSVLRRMGWVQGRRRDKIRLADGSLLDPTDLDEALFPLPEVIDFQAAVGSTPEGDLLHVTLCTHRSGNDLTARALAALNRVPLIRSALAGGALRVGPMAVIVDPNLTGSAAKRKIVDQRVQGGSDESHR